MELKRCLFAKFIILCLTSEFVNGKPMVGENIRQANEGEFSYVASIKTINFANPIPENDHAGTGVIITRRDVLTAAHVLENLGGVMFQIIIGSTDIRNGRKFNVYWWMTYEKWSSLYQIPNVSQMNDIAIIRLTKVIPDRINPVSLSPISASDLYGLEVTIVGWGKTVTGEISRYLKTTVLKIMSNRECESRMLLLRGLIGYVPINIMCSTSNPYAVMADGDSGGPVLYNGALVGIHKGTCLYPDECFHPNKINLHMSINHYRNFINHVINIS